MQAIKPGKKGTPSFRNFVSIEYMTSDVFVVSWLVLSSRKILVLASRGAGLFLKYSYNFPNFSLDILIKFILIEKKSLL